MSENKVSRAGLVAIVSALLIAGCASPPKVTKAPVTTTPTAAAAVTPSPSGVPTDSETPEQTPTEEPTPEPDPTTEDPSPEPDAPQQLTLGHGIIVSTEDPSASAAVTVTKAATVRPGQYDAKATHGRYLQVTIKAMAIKGPFDVNPYDFELTDAAGQTYDQTFVSSVNDHDYGARTLSTGQRALGSITYDVPRKGTLYLAFKGGGLSNTDLAIWTIK